ncbi:MAG: PEP-CTERM sorting domain-containing protein [Planctomycetota bacterium]
MMVPRASSSLLINGGFDVPATFFAVFPGVDSDTDFPGWDLVITNGFAGVSDDNGFATDLFNVYASDDGTPIALITDADDRPAASAGTEYTLTLRSLNENSTSGFTAAIEFFDASGTFLAGTPVSLGVGAAANTAFSYTTSAIAPVDTAAVGVRLQTSGDSSATVLFDDVALIPEPGSLALAVTGLVLIAARRRR